MAEPTKLQRRDGTESYSHGPGHGGPAKGAGDPPFEPGNTLAVRHGAYSRLIVSAKGEEIADDLRANFGDAADEVSLRLLSEALAQVQLASTALHELTNLTDDPKRRAASRVKLLGLSDDLRSWTRECLRLLDRLGATPQARSEVAARLASVQRRDDEGDVDFDRLPIAERAELIRLLNKTKGRS